MENDPLDHLLAAYAKHPIPPPPANLESRVWREIRARRSQPAAGMAGRFAFLWAWWGEWQRACTAVAVAVFIGVVMGHLGAKTLPDSTGPLSNQTGESLGLGVFSADPPAMPSTLLARQP